MARSRRSAREAGSRFERLVADFLADVLDCPHVDRRVKTGPKDRGDIGGVVDYAGRRVVIECKDTTRMTLPQWMREVEAEAVNDGAEVAVVVHKRRGVAAAGEQYVTMTLRTLALLIGGEVGVG